MSIISSNKKFKDWFGSLTQPQESRLVALAAFDEQALKPEDWRSKITSQVKQSAVINLEKNTTFSLPDDKKFHTYNWFISSFGLPKYPVGSPVKVGSKLDIPETFKLPIRIVGFPAESGLSTASELTSVSADLGVLPSVSLQQLGIVEADNLLDDQKYPYVQGKGEINEVQQFAK